MSSPNAGKVLLGADGNLLLGAAGKVVLADDLYPMVPTQQDLYFYRTTGKIYLPDYAAPLVWALPWSSASGANAPSITWWAFSTPNYSGATQTVCQTTFDIAEGDTDPIDWPRVKKITQVVRTFNINGSYAPTLRITKAINISSVPDSYGIRDDWTLVQDLGYQGSYVDIKIEWVIDGVKPDNIAYALAYTAEGNIPYNANGGNTRYPVRVVYNLES
jgi:hypothetical protein